MKKIMLLATLLAFIFISCGSKSAQQVIEKDVLATKDTTQDKLPLVITQTPSEFGLTDIKIEKNEDGGDCSGKGNIRVEFTISFADSTTEAVTRVPIYGNDCEDKDSGMLGDGKIALNNYKLLQNAKASDLQLTYVLFDHRYNLTTVSIKEKRVAGKDGFPAKVTPEVVIWHGRI